MVRLADGSLVVADDTWLQIRLYSPEGSFVRATGRDGEGPGEFSGGIEQMVGAGGDTVWVLDWDGRVSVFGPDLALARTFSLLANASSIHDLGDGSMAVEYISPFWTRDAIGAIRNPTVLWRFDVEGTRLDSIAATEGYDEYVVQRPNGNTASVSPLFRKEAQVASHAGSIFVGNAEFMEVEERTREGDLVRILRIPDYPLSLSRSALRAEREAYLDGRSSSLLHEAAERTPASGTRPAYSRMIVDLSGAVWLQQYRGESEAEEPDALAGARGRRNVAGDCGPARQVPHCGHRDGRGAGCLVRRTRCSASAGVEAGAAIGGADHRPHSTVRERRRRAARD